LEYLAYVGTKRPSRGVSKGEWLKAGLNFLSERGIAGLTVEGLARSLGIAKAGFYWHFKDRADLLRQLLDYWVHEQTEVVTDNPEVLALDAKNRLARAAEMVHEHALGRYDIAIRQWALHNSRAAREVRKVNRVRLDFIRAAFRELGFTGDDADMRAMLFVCYHTWESTMFREISRKRRRELIAKRIELLTSR
jgi:AcrR family transcriptional regulator